MCAGVCGLWWWAGNAMGLSSSPEHGSGGAKGSMGPWLLGLWGRDGSKGKGESVCCSSLVGDGQPIHQAKKERKSRPRHIMALPFLSIGTGSCKFTHTQISMCAAVDLNNKQKMKTTTAATAHACIPTAGP